VGSTEKVDLSGSAQVQTSLDIFIDLLKGTMWAGFRDVRFLAFISSAREVFSQTWMT